MKSHYQPYQPKTGQPCHCRPGAERNNCPDCEGTGMRIDFAAIRGRTLQDKTTKRSTFSAIWTDRLGSEIKSRCVEPYPIECHQNSDDFNSLAAAVNQGIDSHLEAVMFSEFDGDSGKRGFRVEPQTLHVLVRRLLESEDENANSLAGSICETLNIELV